MARVWASGIIFCKFTILQSYISILFKDRLKCVKDAYCTLWSTEKEVKREVYIYFFFSLLVQFYYSKRIHVKISRGERQLEQSPGRVLSFSPCGVTEAPPFPVSVCGQAR